MRHLKTYLLSSMVFLFMGCSDIFSDSGFEKNKERCKSGGKKARENAKQQKGFVGYLPDEDQYFIYYGVDGTYDTSIVGFVCALPEKLRHPGMAILFNGRYTSYTGSLKPIIVGQEYYNLDLTEYSIPDTTASE